MKTTKKLTEDVSVCSFVSPDELPALAKQFRTIINNRPDAEEPGQPSSAELEAAARELGLEYVHIPVIPGQYGEEQVEAFAKALADNPGAKLAFCRTGTRSASLWALSQAGNRSPADILAAASAAGYDLNALAPRLSEKVRAK